MEIIDGKLWIRCQGCIGASSTRFYKDKNKSVKFVCKYCKNTKQMTLTNYLEIIGNIEGSNRVKRYEQMIKDKPLEVS